jgi:hypothetical protein
LHESRGADLLLERRLVRDAHSAPACLLDQSEHQLAIRLLANVTLAKSAAGGVLDTVAKAHGGMFVTDLDDGTFRKRSWIGFMCDLPIKSAQ